MSRWFDAPLVTLAFCWRLDRRDGVTLGLTSHDQPLRLAGLVFRAAPGMLPSAIERSAGLEPDSVQLSGALTSSAICADDLAAGAWDGARLRLWAVNWTAPDMDPVLLVRGHLGSVEMAGARFSVELIGAPAGLDAPATETTTPHCRARLGDARCRVNMAGRSVLARVVAQEGAVVTIDPPPAADLFAFGQLRWTQGPRAGVSDQIVAQSGALLTLASSALSDGDGALMVELTEGCDRRFATCCRRFGNAANFRGEPHLPGNDLLLRYGG